MNILANYMAIDFSPYGITAKADASALKPRLTPQLCSQGWRLNFAAKADASDVDLKVHVLIWCQESVPFLYDRCTNLCTISWLSFYESQWVMLLKVYIPFSTSPFLFSSSSRTRLGVPWLCNDPWQGGRASWRCHSVWGPVLYLSVRLHISEQFITIVLRREGCLSLQVETFIPERIKSSPCK